MGVLVDRRRVLQRIRRSAVALIALVAPAGYGKSYIAHRIAREDPHWATLDIASAPDAEAFAQLLSGVPKLAEHGADGLDALVGAWGACTEPITLILENIEHAGHDLLEAVAMLVRARPPSGKLIMCARRSLPAG